MRSTAGTENLFDDRTEIREQDGPVEDKLSNSPTLITVWKRRNIILVHLAAGKIVSIGRSKQNDIHLSDPSFPRKAAEIILGPVPLLRKITGTGEKSHEIIPIAAVKPIKINPYTFCLLKHGDILINRHNKMSGLITSWKLLLILITATVMVTMFINNFHLAPNTSNSKTRRTIDPVMEIRGWNYEIPHPLSQEVMEFSDNAPKVDKEVEPDDDKTRKAEKNIKIKWPTKNRSENISAAKFTHLKEKMVPVAAGILSEELGILIKAAKEFICLGEPEQAGRAIAPVLRYLSSDQESYLIQSLEPEMRSLYQRAYMLRDYDRPAAKAIFGDILRSNLRMLPSYEKARTIFESERKIEAALKRFTR